jgi:hypothetical protein
MHSVRHAQEVQQRCYRRQDRAGHLQVEVSCTEPVARVGALLLHTQAAEDTATVCILFSAVVEGSTSMWQWAVLVSVARLHWTVSIYTCFNVATTVLVAQ